MVRIASQCKLLRQCRSRLFGVRLWVSVVVAEGKPVRQLVVCGRSPRLSSSAPAGSRMLAQEQPVFRGAGDAVRVFVTVTDRDGRLVTSLAKKDFEVRDEGKPQPITLFDNTPQPIRLVVMLDVSGSMKGNLPLLRAPASSCSRGWAPRMRTRRHLRHVRSRSARRSPRRARAARGAARGLRRMRRRRCGAASTGDRCVRQDRGARVRSSWC